LAVERRTPSRRRCANGDKIAVAVDVRGGKPAVRAGSKPRTPRPTTVRDVAMREVATSSTPTSAATAVQHLDYAALHGMLNVLADTGTPATLISPAASSIEDIIVSMNGIEGAIVGRACTTAASTCGRRCRRSSRAAPAARTDLALRRRRRGLAHIEMSGISREMRNSWSTGRYVGLLRLPETQRRNRHILIGAATSPGASRES
jgi:hypothetical protein